MNVFYHPGFVLADKETPAAIDHFCFSMEAASVEQLIGDLRHEGRRWPDAFMVLA